MLAERRRADALPRLSGPMCQVTASIPASHSADWEAMDSGPVPAQGTADRLWAEMRAELVPPEGFEPSTSRFRLSRPLGRQRSRMSASLSLRPKISTSNYPAQSASYGGVAARREYVWSTAEETLKQAPLTSALPSRRADLEGDCT